MTEKHEESGTEEETGNRLKIEDDENIDQQESAAEKERRGFSQYYPMRRRLFIFLRTSLPVKKLLARVIENKERTEEDRALPRSLQKEKIISRPCCILK